MEARHLLKSLKDDGWYLGDTDGASRQYVHPEHPEVITVCVRYTEELGPGTVSSARSPAPARAAEGQTVLLEETGTGVSAYSPELPGCVATGSDPADARQRMAEAMRLHLRAGGRGRRVS
jgi:predicted RNA binding protein YcfA (HicA-like mRNA interferase family)